MTKEEVTNLMPLLASSPGLAVRCTNPAHAMSYIKEIAKAHGLDVFCMSSLSPMEIYVVNKAHEAVAGVYRGRGLPPAEAARLQLQRHEQVYPDSVESVSGSGGSESVPGNPSYDGAT